MGAWKAQVGLEPQNVNNPDQSEELQRAIELIKKKDPVVTPQSLIDKTTKKLNDKGFVENIIQRYENDWKNNSNIVKEITPDMFVPDEMMK